MLFLVLYISRKKLLVLFKVKFCLKHLHKDDLKTTQNPQNQPGGVLKKLFLKISQN